MSQEKRDLTIIIPVWNREEVVTRTLQSVAAQKQLSRCRLILVDNNSTDRTKEVMSNWIEHDCPNELEATLTCCERAGAAAARNHGLSLAQTDLVMHFDSDDIMNEGLIDRVLHEFDSDKDCNIVSWDIAIELPSKRFIRRNGLPNNPTFRDQIVHSRLSTQRYAIKRETLINAGGWDETCLGWDDFELGLRIMLQPLKVRHIAQVLAKTFVSSNSITEGVFSNNPQKWERPLNLMEAAGSQKEGLGAWIDYRRAILAAEYRREGDKADTRRLLQQTLNGKSKGRRLIYNLIYWKHRIFHRGTHIIAQPFLPKI